MGIPSQKLGKMKVEKYYEYFCAVGLLSQLHHIFYLLKILSASEENEIYCIYFFHFSISSLYKRDCRAVFIYVMENSDDFHIFFSSESQRLRWVA